MARDTLLDFFTDFADLADEFLVYDDGFRSRHFRYREVATLARAFAARLRDAGIANDDKIILYGENRPEWIIALWGCLLQGVVAVPIDYRSAPEFVARIDTIVHARAILVGDEVKLPDDPRIWKLASLSEALAVAPAPPVPIDKNQLAEILFTSGATAEPKGVLITHRNILANIVPVEGEVKKYIRYERPFHPVRFLNLLPLSHMFGQAMATFIPPMLPGVVVFMRGFNPSEIVRQIRSRRDLSAGLGSADPRNPARIFAADLPGTQATARHEGSLAAALVAIPQSAPAVRMEVLELHRRRGAAAVPSSSSSSPSSDSW